MNYQRDFNPIIGVAKIQSAFIDWCEDHYQHFGHYPENFIYTAPWGEDIEYTEKQVYEAIGALF